MSPARRASALIALLALTALCGCGRDAPTELGPEASAPPAPASPSPSAAVTAAAPSRISADAIAAADSITGDDVRRVVAEIADDRYRGRAPGTAGDKLTRAYLAKQLEELGFEPGAEGGKREQPVELVGSTAAAPAKWAFKRGGDTVELARGTEFIVASGVQAPRAALDGAELVF